VIDFKEHFKSWHDSIMIYSIGHNILHPINATKQHHINQRKTKMKAIDLDHYMVWQAAKLMEREGGSFAAHIAEAFFVADSHNREALLAAFDDLFCKFYREYRGAQIRGEKKSAFDDLFCKFYCEYRGAQIRGEKK